MGIGLLRVLLATSIVIAHTSKIFGYNIVDGVIAVQAFYMISGFYMALILNERYDSVSLFVTNRFLRLYPIYIVVLILTILLALFTLNHNGDWGRLTYYRDYYHVLHPLALLSLLLTNLLIFGQDIIMFLGLDTNSGLLYFTKNFYSSNPPLFKFLLVPQAWTLGIELMFYLIAPFVVKRNTWFIICLFALSCSVRLLLHREGLTKDPWNYRFFPAELAFFLTGSLSYKVYKKIKWLKIDNKWSIGLALSLILILFTVTFQFIPIVYMRKKMMYYVILALSLPVIFLYARNIKLDRTIGELSYPIYISHIFVITLFSSMNLVKLIDPLDKSYYAIIIVLTTISFSVLLMKYVQQPIDNYRAARIRKKGNQTELVIAKTIV